MVRREVSPSRFIPRTNDPRSTVERDMPHDPDFTCNLWETRPNAAV